MHEFFRDYGITPLFETGFSEVLLKEGCPEGLDLLDHEQFPEMREYWSQWYTK